MGITTRQDGDRVEIQVQGRFDFNLHREFRNTYRNISPGPSTEYVVDLRDVEYLDSSALGMLLLLREHGGGDRAKISLRNCQASVCKLLQIANFQRLFLIV